MTSQERVLASLNHRSLDKIPIDFPGHRSSGISALAYPKLRQYLGLHPSPIRVYDQVQQQAILDDNDLGGQSGPLISPKMYRQYFKPFHRKLWARAKEIAGVKVLLHCCGGVRELLPDLIDAGLDAIHPVQFNCTGMDTNELT